MKILHIIATLDPAAGGPIQSVRTMMSYASIGYIGEVVTFDDPNAPFLKDLKFPVHPLGAKGANYGYTPKLIPWLKANQHRFDGIVVNGLWQFCGLGARLAVKGKKPYLVFSHGMLDPYFKKAFPLKHFKKAVYWYLAEYWVLKGAYRVLFTTAQEEKLARQSFALNDWTSQVVPYGSGGPPCTAEDCLPAFFQQMPAMRGKRFLVYLGRIHRKKGVDLLVEAFAQKAHLDPALELVIGGPDQQGWAAELQKIAEAVGVSHRIHWPGMLEGRSKWGALYAAEAFILPSHQENFGIAVAEALSCSLPVLVSDQVNIAPEVVEDGVGLMEPDTLQGTENLIQRWINTSPEERETMRTRAPQTFHARYDMQETARTVIDLFKQALQR